MKRYLSIILFNFVALSLVHAQDMIPDMDGQFDAKTNTFNPNAKSKKGEKEEKKETPRGMYVWTVDPLFGDRIPVERDTLQHLFMNSVFTSGKYGEYNTLGNLGSPRLNRIFMDRSHVPTFLFTDNLDFFLTPVEELRFTNTLSPITSLNFYTCGDRVDGEDYLKVLFANNVNKQLGFGMKFNYMYGRGYYQGQSTALFDYTFWTSYLGERYQAHFTFSTDHLKVAENGGISNDKYITSPEMIHESYIGSEIPTVFPSPGMSSSRDATNWNKNDALHFFLTHRYNVGFYRKVPMTKEEIEAKKFAMASRKEAEDREKKKSGDVDEKGRPNETMTGRPKDAKIEGDLPTDTTATATAERISVDSEAKAETLIAEKAKEAEDTAWMKNEYVPVTSFIHTATVDHYGRDYIAHSTPTDYYLHDFYGLKDKQFNDYNYFTKVDNTFAIALLEGFNKYVPAGLKAFATYDHGRYVYPGFIVNDSKDSIVVDSAHIENNVYIGGQLTKTLGSLFHYDVKASYCIYSDQDDMKHDFTLDGTADVNVPIFGDTVTVNVDGFYHSLAPDYLLGEYHGRHYSWKIDEYKQKHMHIGGAVSFPRTKTSLRVGWDFINNYTYLGTSHEYRGISATDTLHVEHTAQAYRATNDVHVFTAELAQDFKLGILNWNNRITYQKCNNNTVLPLPELNLWSNLYIDFKIARVLKCHLGADVTYFTKYNAPEYVPGLAQFAVQQNSVVRKEIGNYPFVDVYANFMLKGCRFFVMFSHVNAGSGNKMSYFTVPHYPMNERVFRFGVSWTFYN